MTVAILQYLSIRNVDTPKGVDLIESDIQIHLVREFINLTDIDYNRADLCIVPRYRYGGNTDDADLLIPESAGEATDCDRTTTSECLTRADEDASC